MFSSDQTKGDYLSEKGLTDVNNEADNRITSEDQTKKRKTLSVLKHESSLFHLSFQTISQGFRQQ